MSAIWTVLVGNVGTVIQTHNEAAARGEYAEWCHISGSYRGRAAGERVTLFKDGVPVLEYGPEQSCDACGDKLLPDEVETCRTCCAEWNPEP